MKIVLCTLALNEMEWLPRLYEQHKDWPDLAAWVFVESADRQYATANPDLVTDRGLSTDGTSEWLRQTAVLDERVRYVPYGFSEAADPAQGKCASRQQYLTVADEYAPDYLMVLDADEFYTRFDQGAINRWLLNRPESTGWVFRQRHVWRPPSIRREKLLRLEVQGGFWDIPHARAWRWSVGLTYARNHNTPQRPDGTLLDHRLDRADRVSGSPQCVHFGFASDGRMRLAKNRYYEQRGEGSTADRKRSWYVESRAAFEHWVPGRGLPHGAGVVRYTGPIPEVFQ